MYLDAFSLSALVDEFLDTLAGGRVQDSLAVDESGIGLEIYANRRRHYLYISGDTHTPRIHLVADKLRRGLNQPTQLGLLVRRYVEGGIVEHISQPPYERILNIDIAGPEGMVTLVLEPMERRSNLLLLRDGIIMDCLRRVGAGENRYRVSLPAHPYQLPPPQLGKYEPTKVTIEDMLGMFANIDDPKRKTQQVLASKILGISPLLAKEIVYRTTGKTDQRATDADPDALLETLREIAAPLSRREWQPGLAYDADDDIAAYSVYPITHLARWETTDSLNDAMNRYYGGAVGEDAYNRAKAPMRDAITEARAKLNAKLASLQRSMTDDSEREVLRQSGELILAYQYTLQPDQTMLEAQYDADAPALKIDLNPQMTPLENAQRYFDRYNRAKRALDDVPDLMEHTITELAALDQWEIDLELSKNWSEIDEVQQALQSRGYWRGKPRAKIGGGKSAPLRIQTKDGFVIWIGRNSRQNEMVTFDKGSPYDLWLHARDVPGAHVIIKKDGREIPETIIEQAAQIAAYYSGKRADGRVIVDVTERRYVKKISGGAAGMVTYRNETTRTVTPQKEPQEDK